jgi:hypothetical protein
MKPAKKIAYPDSLGGRIFAIAAKHWSPALIAFSTRSTLSSKAA